MTYTRFEIPRWHEKWTNQNNQCYIDILIFVTKPASVRQIGELFSVNNERKRNEYANSFFRSKIRTKIRLNSYKAIRLKVPIFEKLSSSGTGPIEEYTKEEIEWSYLPNREGQNVEILPFNLILNTDQWDKLEIRISSKDKSTENVYIY